MRIAPRLLLSLALLALLPLQMAADKPTGKEVQDPSAFWDPTANEQKGKAGKYLITCPGMPASLWNAVAPPMWFLFEKTSGVKPFEPAAGPLVFRMGQDKVGAPMKSFPGEAVGYSVQAPKTITPNEPLGLIIHLAEEQVAVDGSIASPFESFADSRRYVLITVNRAGDLDADPWRALCAVAAVELAQRRYNIQPERSCISGFAGGGEIASYLMLRFPDLFRGAMPMLGFRQLLAWEHMADIPEANMALFYKNTRVAVLEGGKDPLRDYAKKIVEEAKAKTSFITYIEDPGAARTLPKAPFLEQALDYMDQALVAAGVQEWEKAKPKIKDDKKKGECLAALRPFAGVMYAKGLGGEAQAAFDGLNKAYAAALQKAEDAVATGTPAAAQKAIAELNNAWGVAAKDDVARLKKPRPKPAK